MNNLWLAFVGRGLVGAIAGLAFMTNPWMSRERLAGVLVAYLLADGALSGFAATRAHKARIPSAMLALGGAIAWAAAAVVPTVPTLLAIRIVAGVRAIARGACDLAFLRGQGASELLSLGAIVSVFLGALILSWPGPATVALPWLLGIEAMVTGAVVFAGGASEMKRIDAAREIHA